MMAPNEHSAVLVVRARGTFDEMESHRVLDEVTDRTTSDTTLIVVSLADATDVRWNALCRLARAVHAWRSTRRNVVIEALLPSRRALLASIDGLAPERVTLASRR